MLRYNGSMNQVDARRVAASIAACINIPIHALENEKCLIERMLDVLANNGWTRKPKNAAEPEAPVLTEEMVRQIELLEANGNKYFNLYQTEQEKNGQLKMQLAQLEAENERLKRKK